MRPEKICQIHCLGPLPWSIALVHILQQDEVQHENQESATIIDRNLDQAIDTFCRAWRQNALARTLDEGVIEALQSELADTVEAEDIPQLETCLEDHWARYDLRAVSGSTANNQLWCILDILLTERNLVVPQMKPLLERFRDTARSEEDRLEAENVLKKYF